MALVVDWLAKDAQLQPQGYLGALLVLLGVTLAALRFQRAPKPRIATVSGGGRSAGVAAAGCSEEVVKT